MRTKAFFCGLYLLALSSCQMTSYIFSSAKNQFSMMSQRIPIEEALKLEQLSAEQKQKLLLTQEAREFAFNDLKLKHTSNYDTFIDLKRPYVTWVVHASEPWQLKNYQWSYPFLGKMPYKGFFTELEAEAEAASLKQQGFDTLVRGVSAYSTLGYFKDSVLSSMLNYKEYDLVNTIIHETVHTTLYIKNNSDFNERLAVFIGNKGTELFYQKKEGPNSETVQKIKQENEDELLFSNFISEELKKLESWYNEMSPLLKEQALINAQKTKEERLLEISKNFKVHLKPQLKTMSFNYFENKKLNNAYLGLFKTYNQNLNDFEILFKNCKNEIQRFLLAVKKLESSTSPEKDLQTLTCDSTN